MLRFFFEDANFPQISEVDESFSEELENSLRKAFHLVDLALADDRSVSSSSGTTALTAMIFGRYIYALELFFLPSHCAKITCFLGLPRLHFKYLILISQTYAVMLLYQA